MWVKHPIYLPEVAEIFPWPIAIEAIFPQPRGDGQGGGIALIVRKEYAASRFTISVPYQFCELLAVQLPTSSRHLNIIMLHQLSTHSTVFYSELHDLLEGIYGLPGRSIICRAFNSLLLLSPGPRLLDQHLIDILAGHNMQQHVSAWVGWHTADNLLITSVSSSVLKSSPSKQAYQMLTSRSHWQNTDRFRWQYTKTMQTQRWSQ